MLTTRWLAQGIFCRSPLKNALLCAGLAGVLAAVGVPTRAADGTWNVDAAGSWSTAANWVGSTIPGTTTGTTSTDTAWFSRVLTVARTVTVDSNRNIRNITFDDGNSSTFGYTLSGGSLLLTSGGTIQATGSLGAHADTIATGMTILGNNATYTFANNSSLSTRRTLISGSITGQSITGGTTALYLGGNNSGTNVFSGALNSGTLGGTLALVKEGSTTWDFSGGNRWNSGPITINDGSLLVRSQSQVFQPFGSANAVTLANVAGAQLDFGTTAHNAIIGFGSLVGGGANGGNIVNAARANSNIFIGYDNTSTTYGGRFISDVAFGGIVKVGTGTLTLTGSGNDAGGPTQLRGGGLRLDFSQAWTGTDILVATRGVQFAGGRLLLTGSFSGASNSQAFASTTVSQGNSGIALTSNGASGLLASLGAITRNAGGTLDVTLPVGTQSATNGVRTTSTTVTNGVTTSSTVAYLTVGGTTWGVTSGTNVAGLSSYATGAVNFTGTNNVDVTNGDTISTGTVNTLRFNGSNTLNLTGTTTIGAGGVLVTNAATAGAAFSGGTLRPGGGNELVLISNGSLLTVGSVIANNGSTAAAVTLSGTGGFRLDGNNTYTGVTTISSGSVAVGSATALGASGSSAVWIGDNANAVLDLNGFDISIGSLAGAGGIPSVGRNTFGTPGGLVSLGTNSLTVGNLNTSTEYGGRISGSGTLTKVGTGNLRFTGMTSLSNFSGVIAVESGTLSGGNIAAVQVGSGDPLGLATIQLGKTGGGLANATFAITGTTARPIVLAPSNTGTLTLFGDALSLFNPYYGGTVSGTGDLVISNPNNTFMYITGTVNNIGKVRFSSVTSSRVTLSGAIGADVTDLTIDNNTTSDPNNIAITLSGAVNNTGMVYFQNNNTVSTSVNGTIGNASGIRVSGTGNVGLNAANTFTGDTLISSGTLTLGNNLALQNSGINTSGTGLLVATSRTTPTFGGLIGSTSLSTTNIIGYGAITALTLNPQVGKSYTYSGNIGNGAANMTFTKSGSGTQVLSGSNSYSGATTISGGILQLATTNALYGGTAANWLATNIRTGSGATLAVNVGGSGEFSAGNVTTLLTNLASSTSANNGMTAGSFLGFDTTNASGGSFTILNAITNTTGTSGGARGLRKLGTGNLVLAGTSTYTGPTIVSQGSLLVNGQLGNTAVTVQSGGLLGGAGTLLGAVSVAAGGTFSPGNSPGLFSTGELVLAGATLIEIDGLSPSRGVNYDAVNVAGQLTYGGSLLIDFGPLVTTAFANNTIFDLFDFTSHTGVFSSITTANDGSWYAGLTFASTGNGDTWKAEKASQTLEFTYSTGNLVIVPEPGAIALAGIGIAAAAYACRPKSPARKRLG